MPKIVQNQLSAAAVRNTRAPGRYADGNGLYLHVSDTGARWWLWRGTVRGKRVERGLGPVRLIGLKEAREIAVGWSRAAREGTDPARVRDADRVAAVTLEDASRTVFAEHIEPHARNPKHRRDWISSLERYAFPKVGSTPVAEVGEADVLKVLAPIWTERPETARRVRQRLRTVFDWARTAGHRPPDSANPADRVAAGLPKQRDRVRHHTALPYADLPALYARICEAGGVGALALRFTILTAVRSGEVRGALWAEIDPDAAVWTVPADRMKAKTEHRVPLSDEALATLELARGLDATLVFPGARRGTQMSDMTLAAVLKRLKVPVTVHGFRSTFRDWAEETTDFSREVKEAALAHQVESEVERAYRRTDLFDKRRELMAAWGEFCTAGCS